MERWTERAIVNDDFDRRPEVQVVIRSEHSLCLIDRLFSFQASAFSLSRC